MGPVDKHSVACACMAPVQLGGPGPRLEGLRQDVDCWQAGWEVVAAPRDVVVRNSVRGQLLDPCWLPSMSEPPLSALLLHDAWAGTLILLQLLAIRERGERIAWLLLGCVRTSRFEKATYEVRRALGDDRAAYCGDTHCCDAAAGEVGEDTCSEPGVRPSMERVRVEARRMLPPPLLRLPAKPLGERGAPL